MCWSSEDEDASIFNNTHLLLLFATKSNFKFHWMLFVANVVADVVANVVADVVKNVIVFVAQKCT